MGEYYERINRKTRGILHGTQKKQAKKVYREMSCKVLKNEVFWPRVEKILNNFSMLVLLCYKVWRGVAVGIQQTCIIFVNSDSSFLGVMSGLIWLLAFG